MSVITPDYTDNVTVMADQLVVGGAEASGTFDLITEYGGWLDLSIARVDDTAVSANDMSFHVYPTMNAGAITHPDATHSRFGAASTAADNVVATTAAVGDTALILTSATGFAADDVIAIMEATPSVTRLEFSRVKEVGGSTLSLTSKLQFEHTSAQADIVTNAAEVFNRMWLAGGTKWVIVFHNKGTATVAIRAKGISLDSNTST